MTIRQALSSLQLRLVLLVLLTVAPPLVALLVTLEDWRQHETAEAQAAALQLAKHAAAIHQRLVDRSSAILGTLPGELPVVRSDAASVDGGLIRLPDVQAGFSNVGVVRAGGAIEWLAPGATTNSGRVPASLRVVERARGARSLAIGDYEFDRSTGRSALTIAIARASDTDGAPGVAFAVIDAGWLQDLVVESQFPKGTTIEILDGSGKVLVHAPAPPQSPERPGRTDLGLARVIAVRREGTTSGRAGDGVPRLFGVSPLKTDSRNLYIAVGVPQSASAAEIDRVLSRLAPGFGGSLLIALVIASVGVRWSVVRPLTAMSRAARRVSLGELGARTGVQGAATELGSLARAFDAMAETLQKREREATSQTERLAAQERRFRALIENAADGVVLTDADGVISYVSPSTSRILGYASEELVGRSAFAHTHEEDQPAQATRFSALLRLPGATTSARLRVRHMDGSWRWIESAATNLLQDPDVRSVVVNYRDITTRLEAEDLLRKAHEDLERRVEERTAALLKANETLQQEVARRAATEQSLLKFWSAVEQTADCMFMTDRNGVIEYVNPAFVAVTGYSSKEAIGSTPRLLGSGQHTKRFYDRLWQTILAGRTFRAVFINRAKDGTHYHEDRTITPVIDAEGTISHFVSTGRDITKARRTEQALRRMNHRLEGEATRIASVLHDEAGQFLTAAHITLADVARDQPAEARERLEGVRRNLDEVEVQLRRLAHELRPRFLDDVGLVEALKFLADGVAQRAGLDITVETSVEPRCCPLGETAIYRLVQEGLTNISRHARATRVSIVLAQEGKSFVCTLQDDGIGFDPSEAARGGGTGLGLWGIKDRLEAVNGRLDITSAPGLGTTLRATIPLEG